MRRISPVAGSRGLAALPPRQIPIAPGHCDVYKGSLHSQWACCKSHDGSKITCNQLVMNYPKWHVFV